MHALLLLDACMQCCGTHLSEGVKRLERNGAANERKEEAEDEEQSLSVRGRLEHRPAGSTVGGREQHKWPCGAQWGAVQIHTWLYGTAHCGV